MSIPHHALRMGQLTTLGALFAARLVAAAPSAADLAHCSGIADPAARLACYDAMGKDKLSDPPKAVAPGASTSAPDRAVVPTPAAVAEPAAQLASSFNSDPKNFGLTEAQVATTQHEQQAVPKSIEAHIAKLTATRWGSASALLDNGQTWQFVDDGQDARLKPQDPITIKRGSLGSFLLITPSHHSYHVRRLQ